MSERFVALIRHGDYHQPESVPSAWLPYGLNEAGQAQARDCANELSRWARTAGLRISNTIDSSRMRRAFETASLIAAELSGQDRQIAQHDALAERSVGAVANLTVGAIEQLLADDPRFDAPPAGWKSDRFYRLPFQGAESLDEAGERVAGLIRSVAASSTPGELRLIVGHGASLRHAATHLGVLETPGLVSMFHAKPVILSVESGAWRHVAGEWKPRRRPEDSDEYRNRNTANES